MSAQEPPEQRQIVYDGPDTAVWFGRILGVITLAVGLAIAIWAAVDLADSDEVWAFLAVIVMPMSMGFLILVASEGVKRLGRR